MRLGRTCTGSEVSVTQRRGAWMNYSRIALAALGATVAYFVLGGILFGALPSLRKEFMKYPAVYRTQDDMKRVMPMGMIT
jgi:hypothetical protein